MLTFSTNSANLITRLFSLAVTFGVIYIFLTLGLKESSRGRVIFDIGIFSFKTAYILYFLVAIMVFFAVTIVASLLSYNKILVDTTIDSITFVRPFAKKSIATVDIIEYFETVHSNAFKNWHGFLIKTNDDKTIQIAGQNIKSLSNLKDYFTDRKIFCAGQKKMKFPFN